MPVLFKEHTQWLKQKLAANTNTEKGWMRMEHNGIWNTGPMVKETLQSRMHWGQATIEQKQRGSFVGAEAMKEIKPLPHWTSALEIYDWLGGEFLWPQLENILFLPSFLFTQKKRFPTPPSLQMKVFRPLSKALFKRRRRFKGNQIPLPPPHPPAGKILSSTGVGSVDKPGSWTWWGEGVFKKELSKMELLGTIQ